jgi:hypothetical protein
MDGDVARMGEMKNAYKCRRSRRWEVNIKIGLKEVECQEVHWILVAQDKVQWRAYGNALLYLKVLSASQGLCSTWLYKQHFSRR